MQWFIGRGLNPRLGDFDIKAFNEMRPGLILWIVIDFSMMAYQYSTTGRVTDSMILTVAFHTWYVLDAEFNEVRCCFLSFEDRARSPCTDPRAFAARHSDHDGTEEPGAFH